MVQNRSMMTIGVVQQLVSHALEVAFVEHIQVSTGWSGYCELAQKSVVRSAHNPEG